MKFSAFFIFLFLMNQSFALSLREHAMGDACYFIRQKSSFSLCNPANVAREDDQFFYGNFFFSEGVHQSENWKNAIEGNAKAEQIVSLVEDNRISYLTSETNLGLVGKSWAFGFKPYELWVQTRSQNPSNPYVQIQAGLAQVLTLDFGHYLNNELSAGIKVEAAEMKILNRSFFITDLLTENNSVDLEPQKRSHIVVSPGFSFEPENAWSDARYSVQWKQSYVDYSGSLYTGVSFLNNFKLGLIEWGLGTKFKESEDVKPQAFTLFQLGITTLTASLASAEQTYGAFIKLKGFDSGLSYFVTDHDRTLLFQMGFTM